jgi:hypothetical protein
MINPPLVFHVEGKAASEAAMLMREGLWHREDQLWQLKLSRTSKGLSETVRLADDCLWATEKAIGGWWSGHPADFQALLEIQRQKFLNLAGWGWGTLELRKEARRYHPKLMTDGQGGQMWHFYDPRTGNYDSPVDRGWRLCGLPPRRKFEGK